MKRKVREKMYFLDSPSSPGCFWAAQADQCARSIPGSMYVMEEAQRLKLSLGFGCLVSVFVGLRVGLV